MLSDLRVVQKMIDMAVGIPRFTYQMNRNAKRPDGEYAVIRLVNTKNPGYDKLEYIDSPFGVVQRTTGIRILTIDVLFSRDDVEADKFNNSFYRPDIREYLDLEGYALMTAAPLVIKDVKLDTDWEPRTGVTITLSTIRTNDADVGTIEKVSIGGKFNEGQHEHSVGPILVGDFNGITP